MDTRLFYMLAKARHMLTKAVDRRFAREIGITSVQLGCLFFVEQHNGCLLKDLAAGLFLNNSGVTGLVKRMESAGLVKKIASATDGRAFEVHLTQKGEEILQKSLPVLESLNLLMEENYSKDQIHTVLRFLNDVVEKSERFLQEQKEESVDNYEKLRVNLDTNPSGAPEHEAFDEILRTLFTPDEAAVALGLGFVPRNVKRIAEIAGLDEDMVVSCCESMADKGIIFSREKNGEMGYVLLPVIPGLFEFPYMNGANNPMLKRLGKLWETYHLEAQGAEFASSTTPLTRILPVEETVSTRNEVMPYEVLSTMMEKNSTFALAQCACREAAGENACDKPKDVCLIFDTTAEFLIERKLARKITRQEADNVLRRAEEAGLVHTSNNTQDKLNFVCNCCSCCCTLLTLLTKLESPNPFGRGRWRAKVNQDECTGCGICRDERCPASAIAMDDDLACVDQERCIGCGLCVSTCPTQAISMEIVPDYVPPPENIAQMGMEVLLEKQKMEAFMKLCEK